VQTVIPRRSGGAKTEKPKKVGEPGAKLRRSSVTVLRARVAAHAKWATTADRSEATAKARSAFLGRFYDATPAHLSEAKRLQMAESARKAYFAALALKSAMARRSRK
jgi:hypothetical protein